MTLVGKNKGDTTKSDKVKEISLPTTDSFEITIFMCGECNHEFVSETWFKKHLWKKHRISDKNSIRHTATYGANL